MVCTGEADAAARGRVATPNFLAPTRRRSLARSTPSTRRCDCPQSHLWQPVPRAWQQHNLDSPANEAHVLPGCMISRRSPAFPCDPAPRPLSAQVDPDRLASDEELISETLSTAVALGVEGGGALPTFLATHGIAHVGSALDGAHSLPDLLGMVTLGRPAMLKQLGEMGLKLPDRQKLANALTKAVRESSA